MGIDKPDLEAVLHTCLPHSLEEYVQQVNCKQQTQSGSVQASVLTCVAWAHVPSRIASFKEVMVAVDRVHWAKWCVSRGPVQLTPVHDMLC
jgi:hypothetical protein